MPARMWRASDPTCGLLVNPLTRLYGSGIMCNRPQIIAAKRPRWTFVSSSSKKTVHGFALRSSAAYTIRIWATPAPTDCERPNTQAEPQS